MMGGLGAHEYMAPCPAGEDEVALAERATPRTLEVALRRAPEQSARCTRGDDHRRGACARDRARRSRSPTSSSSAPATPSRSGRATSTSTAHEHPIWMGSYGIGPARIVAAAVEQYADEHGISWPRRSRPSRCTWSRSASPARPSARRPMGVYETLRAGRRGGALRRPRPRSRGEVRRRRAARLPAAAHRRAQLAGVRRDRGAAAPRPPERLPACRWGPSRRRCCGRWTSCARASPREHEPQRMAQRDAATASTRLRPSPGRPRPLRPAAAADRRRAAAAAVDDPQRDRLPAAGADPSVPGGGALERRTAPARCPRRCSR